MGLERKQLMMVGVMLFGAFLVVLNQTLLSPAIPTIMIAFDIDAPTAQWLMSGYSLVEAIIIPLSAFFLGRFSTRKLFLAGFSLFAIGSILAAWGPAFVVLLLARVFQAVGTGIVMPMVITVILLVFPREKRGAAMGLVGLIIGFAPAIGPAASGLLVDSVGWHALFMIVSALALGVILLGNFALQDYGNFERTSLDVPSIALSSVGLFCLLYGLSSFSSSPNPVLTIGLIVIGFVVLALFVRRQLHLDNPMLQVTVLKAPQYRIAIISVVIFEAILIGSASYLPLFIQNVCGFSATISGFIMLPSAVIGAVMSMLSGRLFDKYGARGVVVGGCAATLVGGIMLYLLPVTAGAILIVVADIVLIFGIQTAMTPLNTWGVNSLDNSVIQHANALSNTLNQVAASFGTALLISVSAMGQPISTEAAMGDQLFVGYRLAFGVIIVLAIVLLAIAVISVRDRAVVKTRVKTVESEEDELLVSSAMDVDAPFIADTATIRDALFEIARNDTSGVPIVDRSQRVVGFISDGDIMGYLGREDSSVDTALFMYKFVDDGKLQSRLEEMLEKNVMELATKRVVSVESTMDLGDACHVLADRRIKKVPVVDDGKLVGSLSRHNVILGIVEHLPA